MKQDSRISLSQTDHISPDGFVLTPGCSLARALGVRPGITAIIGSGGKTSLLRALSRELSGGSSAPGSASGSTSRRRVLLTTTTHILPFADLPCLRFSDEDTAETVIGRLSEMDQSEICLGSGLLSELPPSNPKLSSPGFPLYELLPAADYILAEADGARHHYMKAHAHYEPVIPERCGRTICVIGVQGFGMTAEKAVHRPEIFCRVTDAAPEAIVTPALYAEFLKAEERQGLKLDCILLNGVHSAEMLGNAWKFADAYAALSDLPVLFADLPLPRSIR